MGELNRILGIGWTDVAGRAEGYPYEVDAQGNVRRKDGGELKPFRGGPEGEYLRVELRADDREPLQVYVHQLVAWAFLPGDPTGKVVHHINDDPRDNRVQNLTYLESQENIRR